MKVNEIFYSIQGEGYHAGEAAIFIRFSGCNLKCPFCDTQHQDGIEMTEEEIVDEVAKYPSALVVITGGEPSLQLTESLVNKLHEKAKFVAVETNGTHPLPKNVDWVTLSPKGYYTKEGEVVLKSVQELKIVVTLDTKLKDLIPPSLAALHCFVQPCDTGNEEENKKTVEYCIEIVKKMPIWKLSLQTQKILNVR